MNPVLILGIILGVGGALGSLLHKVRLTFVIACIISGIALGPYGIGVIDISRNLENMITTFALGLIAFEIGLRLSVDRLRGLGKAIWVILMGETTLAFAVVFLGVFLFTRNIPTSLLLGSLSVATAPAASMAVIREFKARGPLTTAILALVGLDDAVGVLFFVPTLAILQGMAGVSPSFFNVGSLILLQIGGAVVIGIVLGAVLGPILRKVWERDQILLIFLAAVFGGVGLAKEIHVSWILTPLILGTVTVRTLSAKKRKMLREIVDRFMLPIFMVFFTVAGSVLRVDLLLAVGGLSILYVVCRSIAKVGGVSLISRAIRAPRKFQKYLGFSLFPQAGVAIGFALTARAELPKLMGAAGEPAGGLAVTVILATTVILETIGPLGTEFAIFRANEAKKQ